MVVEEVPIYLLHLSVNFVMCQCINQQRQRVAAFISQYNCIAVVTLWKYHFLQTIAEVRTKTVQLFKDCLFQFQNIQSTELFFLECGHTQRMKMIQCILLSSKIKWELSSPSMDNISRRCLQINISYIIYPMELLE